MKISDYPKFESALSQGRPIIFLCGAGLSVSLGDHAKGWIGWLKEGKAYLSDVEAEELDRRFGSYSASELIDAASFLIEALRKNGNYTAYMDSTIGSLRVQNKKLANALALFVRCGDYFATTNYDKLLEEVTGLGYYTYNMPGKIVQMLSGQAEMSVIHLHGIYDAATNTDDIVADQKQYEDVIANQGAQFIQNLISTCTLVILGCGATVDDPNLKGFMSFASKQLHLNIPYFYLHKAGDDLSDLGPNVIPVCYGMEYSDLSNAVEDMANYRIRTRYRDSEIIRVNPYVKTRKSFTASYRLHYLNEFCKFVGREKELVELNKFCSADKELLWWSLVGKGGIGKSRLVYQWLKQLSNNWFALASASVLVCLDDDQGIYQQAAQNLQQYINASQRPGKKQTDFSDLFVYQEYAHDYEMDEVSTLEEIQEEILRRANDPKYLRLDEKGCSKLLTIIAPEYPDIIKEFLVDYYIPKYEWIGFSQAARLGTVTQFDMFLLHAIEDFPDKKSYMEMEFAPLEDERDRFGQWIFVILAAKNLNNFEQIADNLCVSQAPEIICAYEMEVWKDIGIVLTDRGELDRLYTLGLRSADYITDRLDNDVVCECIEEVWDAFFIGVHNAELTQQTANLMDKYNQIADKIAENGYIATWCTENYARLMLLWLRRNDYRSAANCWKQMMKFQQRFADDEDILKAIAGAADALYDIYRENQVPGRRCKLLKDMERIFDETHNADVANALAILEANEHTIYDPPAVFDSNKSEILLSTENKLKEIYEVFPNEGKVVLGYSYLVSWNYVTWLDFPRPIDEELIPLFKKWIRKFPENKLELMEYYSFILFEKWLYMDSLDNISEANKIYYEIKAIADELSKDYADNQVTQMLSMGIVRKL